VRSPLRPLSEATRRRARRTAELSGGTGPTPASSALRGASGPRSADAPVTAGARGAAGATARRPIALANHADGAAHPVRAVVIGASTGGPEALTRLLTSIARPLPVPVLVVQHMPPVFTRQLAQRLDRTGGSTVVEAVGGEELLPGHVYIAPGDHHLELERTARGARTRLTQDPPVNFCRPAVDTLFRTAVDVYGGDLLAVVLTGMGADGRTGSAAVVAAGGTVVVQDEASSVVWGMPGAVAAAGLAHRVLPMDEMAPAVVGLVLRAGDTHPGSHPDAAATPAGTHAPADTPASRTGALTPAQGGAR
jgi:two-component system, chemotaxis family, protein-glutamate methylesterase/glutaminase